MPGAHRVEAYVLINDQGMVMQLSRVDMINMLAALNAAHEAAHPQSTEYGHLFQRIDEAFAYTEGTED